ALAGQTERGEDPLAVEAARRFAAASHASQLHLDGLGLQGNVGCPTIADCAHRSTLSTSTGCIHLRAQTSMLSMMPARSWPRQVSSYSTFGGMSETMRRVTIPWASSVMRRWESVLG